MKLVPINLNEDKENPSYASEDIQLLLQMFDEFYAKVGYSYPWVGYFVVDENTLVGTCSFVGKPQNGIVEISYWTFKEFEGKGIASFSCKELITIAKNTDPTIQITAKTAPEKNASTRILEKNKFVFSEIVQDEEIGDAWLWKQI